MPRRPPVALALLLVAACTSGTTTARSTPGPTPRVSGPVTVAGSTAVVAAQACTALLADLPAALGSAARRPVADPGAAAWGDPAIGLRCGVPAGSGLDEPYVFDGVRWAVHDDGGVNRWTTLGRRTEVRVLVPDGYDAQAELLIALSPALRRTP